MHEDKNHLNFGEEEQRRGSVFFNITVFLGIFFLCVLLISFFTRMVESSYGLKMGSLIAATDENPNMDVRTFLRLNGFISQFFGFLLPGVLFSIFVYKSKWARLLHINKTPKLKNIFLGIALIFSSLPFAYFLYWVNLQIPLPQSLIDTENQTENFITMMMFTEYSYELIFNLVIMAVLPALGEEIIFRGILQRNLSKSIQNPHLPIWITAIIFSAIHFQFEGFLTRMFLGLILGYLFYWTKNLWIPILAHFAHNALSIISVFLYKNEMIENNIEDAETGVGWVAILISFAIMMFLIFQIKKQNANKILEWENDFRA